MEAWLGTGLNDERPMLVMRARSPLIYLLFTKSNEEHKKVTFSKAFPELYNNCMNKSSLKKTFLRPISPRILSQGVAGKGSPIIKQIYVIQENQNWIINVSSVVVQWAFIACQLLAGLRCIMFTREGYLVGRLSSSSVAIYQQNATTGTTAALYRREEEGGGFMWDPTPLPVGEVEAE